MLRFASPGPAEMLAEALQEAENIDIDFLWEVAPQEEFDYQLLVAEYYGENPSVVQQTFASLFALTNALGYYADYGSSGKWCESKIFTHIDAPISEIYGKEIIVYIMYCIERRLKLIC